MRVTASTLTAGFPLAVALCVGGCADDRDSCAYEVCDISEEACIERIAEAVACRRDSPVVVPQVFFASTEEIIGGGTFPSAAELQNVTDYYAGEALVGLMPVGYDAEDEAADSLGSAVAFYSRDTKDVVVISDSLTVDPADRYNVMVHEMIHVYQDAEYDLSAAWDTYATSFDRSLAMRAGIEGEATWYQVLSSVELDGYSQDEINWSAYFRDFQHSRLVDGQTTETPSLDVRGLFPYAFGSEHAYEASREGGRSAVSDLVLDPHDSVRGVMALSQGGPAGLVNRDAELDPHAVPVLPGHTFLGGGHQGAWLVGAMIQRTASDFSLWSPTLFEVAAEYLSVFRDDETGASVAVWRFVEDPPASLRDTLLLTSGTTWADAGSADIDAPPLTHVVADVEGDVVLVGTMGSDAEALLATVTEWESPEQAQGRSGLFESHRALPEILMHRAPARMP